MALKKTNGRLDWELGLDSFDITKEKYPFMNTCPSCSHKWIFYGKDIQYNTIVCPSCGKSELFFKSNFTYIRTENANEDLKKEFINLLKEK